MAGRGLPPLGWLRAFEAAARLRSFTAAARELNMTQSAVSQHIRNLEHFLGRPLFLRRARAVEPTEAGHAYVTVVQDAFARLAAGAEGVARADRGARLALHGNLAFSALWLAPRLGALLERHPWLRLSLATTIWDPDPPPDGASISVRYAREAPAGGIKLGSERIYPVSSPARAVAADWRTEPLFDCLGVTGTWRAWAAARGEAAPEEGAVHLGSTYLVSMTAAQTGAGLALGHDSIASHGLASGALRRPYPETAPMAEAYFLVTPAEAQATPASRAFAEWLQETRAGEEPPAS